MPDPEIALENVRADRRRRLAVVEIIAVVALALATFVATLTGLSGRATVPTAAVVALAVGWLPVVARLLPIGRQP